MTRFDNRTKEEFEKDIFFGTQVEKLFFNLFVESCRNKSHVEVLSYSDNGVCNDGLYVEDGINTSGADYMLEDFKYHGMWFNKLPLEVKWVPTYGKLTLKIGDLKAYDKEGAAILFVYTVKKLDLKKPRDYDFAAHKSRIIAAQQYIRWGIMFPSTVRSIVNNSQGMIKPIPYMGNKPGIIIPQEDFSKWFKEEVL